VTKGDKTGELPANPPAPAARTVSPEQAAYDEANKIKELDKRLPALRKIQADYPKSAFIRQVNSTVLNILIGLADKRSEVPAAFATVAADTKSQANFPPDIQLQLLVSPVSRALDLGFVIDGADKIIADSLDAAVKAKAGTNSTRAAGIELLARIHQANGDTATAEKEFTEALALDPTSRRNARSREDCRRSQRQEDGARALSPCRGRRRAQSG
jgi:hypothetical protein